MIVVAVRIMKPDSNHEQAFPSVILHALKSYYGEKKSKYELTVVTFDHNSGTWKAMAGGLY